MFRKSYLFTAILVVLLFLLPGVVFSEDGCCCWRFTVSPYLWGSGLKGDASVGGTKQDVDISFNDVVKAMEIGAMVDLQAENGPWSMVSNILYVKMEEDMGGRFVRVKVEPTMWIVEAEGRYRVSENWKLLAGIRYYDFDINLDSTGLVVFSKSVDKNWVDPVIGFVHLYPFNEKWALSTRGDIGGFGAGSNFSWQARALFLYKFSENTNFLFGWRHLEWDYETGSGAKELDLDLYMTGPIMGASFHF